MSEPPDPTPRQDRLREDLNREYYAALGAVSEYDGRLMVIKGWSVTLSLAALGLGFQQQHYALFGLAAVTALGFWFLDVLLKGYQMRYYARMRDIEVATYRLNAVELEGLGLVSAPRIDMSWDYKGEGRDWRTDAPVRRDAKELRYMHHLPYLMPHVFLPHVVAVVLGTGLFLAAVLGASWLDGLAP
ncbi:hypothetical protein [Angustibacter luteus]|uniref:DUF2270 domain-containing protein n=1 Tax=Angustibacter luteus TaxID=658456 RepID=A0ABW1JI77_9ACTN